jgi:hypothetical protein
MNSRSPEFPPELRCLLACLRAILDPQRALPADDLAGVPWPRFNALVERHRLAAFLHRRLPPALAERCPAAVRQRLRESATRTAQRGLVQAAEQLRLTRILSNAGIEVLAVKGVALAERLYGGIGVRHVGDIDLCVRPERVAQADALLQAGGLRRTRPDIPLTPRQFAAFLRLKPEFEYVTADGAQRVELLWRLEGLPDAWSSTLERRYAGQALRTLGPETEALYLLQHGARHGWFRLFWLVDVALLWRAQIDWPRVVAQAREQRAEQAVFSAAVLTEELLGAAAPEALRLSTKERRAVEPLARECRRQIARTPSQHEPIGEWARQLRYRVRLQQTWRGKWSVLAPHVLTPESWRTWPLPDRWFFVYYFAAPLLWLVRRVRRN